MVKIIVDMTEVSEAFGEETSYFAGMARVDDHNIICDGCTDRTESPSERVIWYLDSILSDEYNDEFVDEVFECGKRYEITLGVGIKEVRDNVVKINIEIKGNITDERLYKLLGDIDAQLSEDDEKQSWSSEGYTLECDRVDWK